MLTRVPGQLRLLAWDSRFRRSPHSHLLWFPFLIGSDSDKETMSASEVSIESRPQPSQLYRWLVLIFVSLAMFGNYYIYDSINPLERIFLEQLGFSASMFGRLNASYSVAAVATLLIGGVLIDRFGIRKSLLLFST